MTSHQTTPAVREHPAAAAFPMLGADDLAVLTADIEAHGLREPLTRWTDADGAVWLLDGRNRLAACGLAGVEPTWTDFDGDPVTYVLSANVHRRHLSTGQRAMATAVVLARAGRREDGRWKRGSIPGDTNGSVGMGWTVRVREAGVVLDHAADLVDAVLAGAMALDAALAVATKRRRAAEAPDASAVLEGVDADPGGDLPSPAPARPQRDVKAASRALAAEIAAWAEAAVREVLDGGQPLDVGEVYDELVDLSIQRSLAAKAGEGAL